MQQAESKLEQFALPLKGLVVLVVGLILTGWLLSTPPGLLGKADAVGYAVCHRIDARSFHLGDVQMPLCARCSGMYLGAVLGLAFQSLRTPRRSSMPVGRVLVFLGLFAVAFGIDGLNSYLHLWPGAPTAYEPRNWLRLVTGTGVGLGIAAVLYPSFHQTVWRKIDTRPALDGLRPFAILVVLAGLVDLLILSDQVLILYPLALISAGGVLLILSMVYSIVWLMVLRRENRFSSVRQLILPLIAGLGIALLQVAALDYVRFLLTGTWEGFHIG